MAARRVYLNAGFSREQEPHLRRDTRVRMHNEIDCRDFSPPKLPQGIRDGDETATPAFAAMTGNQQAGRSIAAANLLTRSQCPKCSVDRGIPSQENASWRTFSPKVRDAELRRGKEKIGQGIDRHPKLFLGPRPAAIMASKARFDVGDRNPAQLRGQGSPQCTRSVALDDD